MSRFRKSAILIPITAVSAVMMIMIVAGCGPSSPPLNPLTLLPTDAQQSCTVSQTTFNSWFQSGGVALNGVVKPANSILFPNQPNCSFYQWAKQDFLWLTSPAPATYGGGGGLIVDSPTFFDVSPPDASGNRTLIPHTVGFIRPFGLRAAQVGPHGLQLVFDTAGRPLQVKPAEKGAILTVLNASGQRIQVTHARREGGKVVLLDKDANVIRVQPSQVVKQEDLTRTNAARAPQLITAQRFIIDRIPIFIDSALAVIDVEQGEAGDGGVLEAQALPGGSANSGSLVYFATMVNDVYAYYATAVAHNAISLTSDGLCSSTAPNPPCFPTTQAQLNQIAAFAAGHTTFPDSTALAIEVKSAWVVAAGLPNLSSYITMTATIPTYTHTSSTVWTGTGQQQTVKLALVGMHVVGSVAGHPEMIWSTFEHVANAPAATYTYVNAGGSNVTVAQNVSKLPVLQGASAPWVFSATNASSFNNENMSYSAPNITANSPSTISPSNTIRWKAFGGASDVPPNPLDPSTAASNTEIISINNSVGGMLTSGDVRNNYVMTGATWTIGGAAPNAFLGGNQVGTSSLANTTMETYQQGSHTTQAGGTNCFSCHSGFAASSNATDISHMFINQSTGKLGLKPLF